MIKFSGFDSPDQEDMFRKDLELLQWLIPRWCTLLVVRRMQVDDPEVALRIFMQPEYHSARIEVHHGYYMGPQALRLDYLRHELAHLLTGKLVNFVSDRLIPTIEASNPDLASFASSIFDTIVEDVTEELAERLALPNGD